MTTPTQDMGKLRELVSAATQGEWHQSVQSPQMVWSGRRIASVEIADCGTAIETRDDEPPAAANAAFIAAFNPQTCLALLDRVEKAESERRTALVLLGRILRTVDSGSWRDTTHLSIAAHPVMDDVREFLQGKNANV